MESKRERKDAKLRAEAEAQGYALGVDEDGGYVLADGDMSFESRREVRRYLATDRFATPDPVRGP